MSSQPKFDSRKATPWDSKEELTPMEAFLKQHHLAHYEERHRIVADSGEAEMINSFAPAKCPYCGRNTNLLLNIDKHRRVWYNEIGDEDEEIQDKQRRIRGYKNKRKGDARQESQRASKSNNAHI